MGNKFSKKDIQRLTVIYRNSSNITEAAKKFCQEKSINYNDSFRRKVSKLLEKQNSTANKFRLEDTKEFKKASKRKLGKKKYYIVTWEQNETPLHTNFWDNILCYKEFLGAELTVMLGRYKNPTSVFTDSKNENWNLETKPYWDASRHDVHNYLTVLSDVKISPTRKYPLTGLQGLSQGKSIVVGHPKLHMKSEPTLDGYAKKMLFTTGAVTLPNYTDSGVGKISEGNHKYGFVIVEIDDEEVFYIRQVEADSEGNFIDLCYEVKDQNVLKLQESLGMVCGDTHYGHLDPRIDSANDSICKSFNVPNLVLHDVIDGESCNNHIIKDPIQQFKRLKEGKHLIEKELEDTKNWLDKKLNWNPIIVSSNHNNRLDRILTQDWRKDVHNSLFYFKYTTAVMEGKASKGVLAYYLDNELGGKVTCLGYTDSFKVGKYECSQHGDWGANGSRGSNVGFRNLDIPMITAHSHTPYRADDLIVVGTNTYLKLGYNEKGASSWAHCNALIAKNGIAQQLIFVKGKFTTFEI